VHKYQPSAYEEPGEGPVLTRIHVEESFTGDITADGVVEFLQAAQGDGSASFAGIERVTGQLAGRRGTFLLQDAGTVQDQIVSGDWLVIPGSGTGELAGLRGEGRQLNYSGRGPANRHPAFPVRTQDKPQNRERQQTHAHRQTQDQLLPPARGRRSTTILAADRGLAGLCAVLVLQVERGAFQRRLLSCG
jgi:hypothetical protein